MFKGIDYLKAALYFEPILMGDTEIKGCNYQSAILGDSLLKTIWYTESLPRD